MRATEPTRHVVVVDDEADIVEMLTIILENDGCAVRGFSEGASALDSIRSSHPDIVLLDVMMPHLDGIEVLRRLKSDPATSDIPVVMLTAKTSDADVWAGWEAGADYYLTKPFDPDELAWYLACLTDVEPSSVV